MSSFKLYLITNSVRGAVSSNLKPGQVGYLPIEMELDSTAAVPPPSTPAIAELELDVGFYCDDFTIYFQGSNGNRWEITDVDPFVFPNTTWYSSLQGQSLASGAKKRYWTRSSTFFEEVPQDDALSTKCVVEGRVEATA